MVELDDKGDFYQALVSTEADGSRKAWVELAACEMHTPSSQNALAALLLTASDVIRMVRPVVEDRDGRIVAGFGIHFSPNPGPVLLDRGFSSLYTACRLCGREADALNTMRIAEEYLAVRHFTAE